MANDMKKNANKEVKKITKKTSSIKTQKVDKEKKIVKTNKKSINSKKTFTTVEVVSLIIITCIVSVIMGNTITYNKKPNYSNDKNIQEFVKNYNYVLDNYYEDIDKSKLIDNAIKGMLEYLDDDYSYLIDESETNSFNIQLQGEYKGIGVEIVGLENGEVFVYKVFEDSPAEEAGIKPGDVIKEIDGKDFSQKTPTEIADYIKTIKKSNFDIKVERDSETKTLTLKKDSITIRAVDSRIIKKDNKKIGYINISVFSNVAYNQFKKELEKLEKQNIDSLIIDVRDNSGGHLTTATNIISLFLDSKHIIYQTETKQETKKYYSTGNKNRKYPIVVLQNENSASASEMLSAALKEQCNATVVGKVSYGKGTVQELITLTNGSEYKITTKKWLTPKGNWINKKGVIPDVDVTLNEKYYEEPSEQNDNQLQAAIKELTK